MKRQDYTLLLAFSQAVDQLEVHVIKKKKNIYIYW